MLRRVCFVAVALAAPCAGQADTSQRRVGARENAGCLANPKKVDRLLITRPGVYENYLIDSNWQGGNRVKITAGNVTLRHCEIRNATGNGVGVFASDVV